MGLLFSWDFCLESSAAPIAIPKHIPKATPTPTLPDTVPSAAPNATPNDIPIATPVFSLFLRLLEFDFILYIYIEYSSLLSFYALSLSLHKGLSYYKAHQES